MNKTDFFLSEFKETIMGYYLLSEETYAILENIIEFKTFKKNEVMLHPGEVSKHFYYIFKGAVIAYFTDNEGNTYNKNIFLERQFAGSKVSAILQKPSDFTLQSIEESKLISIPYRRFKELIYSNEELKSFYIAYIEKNWIIEKEQREISIVMENATTRYLNLLNSYPKIDQRIPLQHIASHLGITPTQLSRIRKDLEKNLPSQHR